MAGIPKAALYYAPTSIWSAVARLAVEEKGYGSDELDFRVVDITKGENYDPAFLRLNPKATVPTLIVPYENSLTEGIESRYKALTETKTIVEFLDKSRSAKSRTHTTSVAPAPSLTPATIAAATICKVIVEDILHSNAANPNTLRYVNARDVASLRVLAKETLQTLEQRQLGLKGYIAQGESGSVQVSEKVKKLWAEKLEATSLIYAVLVDAEKDESALDEQARTSRIAFFKTARQAWEVNLAETLKQLSKEMIGPYTLGEQLSIADLHLAGWLTRVVKLAGGTASDDGATVVRKVEEHIGGGFRLARDFLSEQATRENLKEEKKAKVAAFWDAIRERASWRKIYGDGLF
ncbi:hypothetical protein NLJ89_g6613 [Agrocybe chaxingu]|uniref:GST N-terminal domain-containing protein n=1 Tax=Agrocybe chaxingu TaxID=84603 RepID=A0A9W8JYX0_9AGAR|nr:hypothetical protein NLJ89_g6613 [Agrocybe chaxingu]